MELQGTLVHGPLICSCWAWDPPQASLQRGADLPVLAAGRRYSVCAGHSWRGLTMASWRPCQGGGLAASSVRPSWEEGRKEGLQLRGNRGFESFPPWLLALFAQSGDPERVWRSGHRLHLPQVGSCCCLRLPAPARNSAGFLGFFIFLSFVGETCVLPIVNSH